MKRNNNINGWVTRSRNAINSSQGETLAQLFSLKSQSPQFILTIKRCSQHMIQNTCNNRLMEPWNEIAYHFLSCLPKIQEADCISAHDHATELYSHFTHAFKESQGIWLLPVLGILTGFVRRVATRADMELIESGQIPKKLEDAERSIKRCFPVTMTDRSPLPVSKKWGALKIINNLMRIYFHLNNLRLCKNLIAYVHGPGFPDLSRFPVSQTVTYNYFVGRLSMFNGNYAKAREELLYAFRRCPKEYPQNKRRILIFLIPPCLLVGKLPSLNLVRKYQLGEFEKIILGIRLGDLKSLSEGLQEHQEFFIQQGIFLILEKLKYLTYRTLFKKVFLIKGTTKLKLDWFVTALGVAQEQTDRDEVECIVANLIHQGYMKGYISHAHAVAVVSNKKAFPALKSFLNI